MKFRFFKILIILLTLTMFSCNVMKRVKDDEHLLISNTVLVNDKRNNTETLNDLVLQKPNGKLLGIPLRLHIYNLARPNIDSILTARYYSPDDPNTGAKKLLSIKQYNAWVRSKKNFNEWLKKTGEAPAIFDEARAERSTTALKKYYFSKGFYQILPITEQ